MGLEGEVGGAEDQGYATGLECGVLVLCGLERGTDGGLGRTYKAGCEAHLVQRDDFARREWQRREWFSCRRMYSLFGKNTLSEK